MENTLYIKNMVCDRCILVVKQELDNLHLDAESVELGKVMLRKQASPSEVANLTARLLPLGFELLDNKRSQLIEQIKNVIIDQLYHRESSATGHNLSVHISQQLGRDYT